MNPKAVRALGIFATAVAVAMALGLIVIYGSERWMVHHLVAGIRAKIGSPIPDVVIAPRQSPPPVVPYRQSYDFIGPDAFSWNLPLWEKLLLPYGGQRDLHYLEIGLAEGRSFIWVLENILTGPGARATGIDLWDDKVRDRFYRNLQKTGLSDRATIINQSSQIALRSLPLESFDIIYVDGSHVKCDVLEDAVLCWRLLKPGGLLIFDDYWHIITGDSPGTSEIPHGAIDAFYSCFDFQCEVLHREWQVVFRKRG